MPESDRSEDPPEKQSCVPLFDALWFCYSPVYQMQQYYKFGKADDCSGQWSNLYNCLKSRTKFKAKAPEAPKKHPLWNIRTPEEAEEYWRKQYGESNFAGQQKAGTK
ncbi:hypothetical protein WJX84_007972 [Apatococcus fuscideae]|uniref:Uncharacterized protein n=1 Tax=Apatococcus fuscideae TaxID=2026836 RepID=A0AAW1SUX3_9CHLO